MTGRESIITIELKCPECSTRLRLKSKGGRFVSGAVPCPRCKGSIPIPRAKIEEADKGIKKIGYGEVFGLGEARLEAKETDTATDTFTTTATDTFTATATATATTTTTDTATATPTETATGGQGARTTDTTEGRVFRSVTEVEAGGLTDLYTRRAILGSRPQREENGRVFKTVAEVGQLTPLDSLKSERKTFVEEEPKLVTTATTTDTATKTDTATTTATKPTTATKTATATAAATDTATKTATDTTNTFTATGTATATTDTASGRRAAALEVESVLGSGSAAATKTTTDTASGTATDTKKAKILEMLERIEEKEEDGIAGDKTQEIPRAAVMRSRTTPPLRRAPEDKTKPFGVVTVHPKPAVEKPFEMPNPTTTNKAPGKILGKMKVAETQPPLDWTLGVRAQIGGRIYGPLTIPNLVELMSRGVWAGVVGLELRHERFVALHKHPLFPKIREALEDQAASRLQSILTPLDPPENVSRIEVTATGGWPERPETKTQSRDKTEDRDEVTNTGGWPTRDGVAGITVTETATLTNRTTNTSTSTMTATKPMTDSNTNTLSNSNSSPPSPTPAPLLSNPDIVSVPTLDDLSKTRKIQPLSETTQHSAVDLMVEEKDRPFRRPFWILLTLMAVMGGVLALFAISRPPDEPKPIIVVPKPPPKEAIVAGIQLKNRATQLARALDSLRQQSAGELEEEATSAISHANFGSALEATTELRRRDNAAIDYIRLENEALQGAQDHQEARLSLVDSVRNLGLKAELVDLFARSVRNDPTLRDDVITIGVQEKIEAVKSLGGGRSISLKMKRKGENVFAFKPEQDEWENGWRVEVAAWRLCQIIACEFSIPRSRSARISREDFDNFYRMNTDKQKNYAERFVHLRWRTEPGLDGVEREYLYGVLKDWVPHFTDFPLEYVHIWQPWLDALEKPEAMDEPLKTAIRGLYVYKGGDYYKKVLRESAGVDTRTLARQLSNVLTYDFLTNNWDRFSSVEDYYGVNNQFASGSFVSIDNGACFHEQSSARVDARYESVERMSRRMVTSVELLDRAWLDPVLFPDATDREQQRLDVFWQRREDLLTRVETLVEAYGESKVMYFR